MSMFLNESDIESLLDMPACIDAVEAIAQAQGRGEAWLHPRQRLRMPKGMLHTMSAAWPARGYFVHKAYASIAGDVRFRVYLYDAATGVIVAAMEGNRLGQLRTGAATAVAARRFWPARAEVWAVFGAGLQAWGQIEALLHVGRPEILRIVCRHRERGEAFCARLRDAFDVDAAYVEQAEAALDGASVVVTATTSKDPVFPGKALTKGAFVAAVGANLLIKREIDGAALQKIDRLVVDDVDTARLESGLLLTPVEAGFRRWSDVRDLPALVSGTEPGRQSPDETLCFHSLGSATWDLAAAIVAYERAKANDIGQPLPLD